ncbi:unnamed protein product [Lactuca virosa]|uniref:Uncharacterized protein n=1 Tax=Lactuca virosa TaxID=75947 RepID=A0AAU9NYM8_9ASTR|nr:unnamed protein product [Lactuca virosa]
MDSAINPTGQDTSVPIVPSISKNIVKAKHDIRKPPCSSTRYALRVQSSERKSGTEKIISLEREPSAVTILHEYPIITDPKLKHVEDNLPSSDVEAPGSDAPLHFTLEILVVPESVDPLLKYQTPFTLFVVVATFQQNLFGVDFELFQASNVQSTTITVDPLPTSLGVRGSSNLTSVEIFDYTPLFGDDTHLQLTADVYQMLPSSEKDALMPTLVTFTTSLPQFQRTISRTPIPKGPKLASVSNEESLDRAHSCLMEGMH